MIKELLSIYEAKCKAKKKAVKKVVEGKDDADLGELVNNYLEANRMYHFEGSRGVSNLDKVIRTLGYRRGMDEFLSDNSGCIEAIIEWIKESKSSEWADNLNKDMGPGDGPETNDVSELVDEYLEGNKMYHFEGSRGVSNLDKLLEVIGYRDIDEFLSDNSGCIEAMLEWIKNASVPEWKEKFAAEAAKHAGNEESVEESLQSNEYSFLKNEGFKKKGALSDGSIVHSHPSKGDVVINKHGEWKHSPHGSNKVDDGFEGTTGKTLQAHLARVK